ncbi:hypothetical protein BIW11_12951 [Tropilaelaps mercedesae]|uniref:Uncharacterized protein n=1 Tax=Tropilaelaps mercedesae TaxID=418985 RepID=A0A1V9X4Q5_9ACAR|nr:hypothetical protein BIW11_12951 [Tropilaelaps mercedesae]
MRPFALKIFLVFFVAAVCIMSLIGQITAADPGASYGNDASRDFNTKRIIALLRRNSRQPNALADSCRFYGHSCLGGHGKRSSPNGAEEVDDEKATLRFDDDWLPNRL